MIYIIAGDIGSGKTLKALHWMQQAWLARRPVWTNIDLLPACPYSSWAVRMDSPGYPICSDHPHSETGHQFFWEFVPNGALIVIDEGDIHFDSADHKLFGANCKIYHKQSRKFDHDVIYIVQNVGNLYKRIRSLAGRFILAEHTYKTLRVMGLIQSAFGKPVALRLSRFIYGEFRCDKFTPKNLAGVGHFSYADALPMFKWYETKQLLGHTETVLKRKQVKARVVDAVSRNDASPVGRGRLRRHGFGRVRSAAGGSPQAAALVDLAGSDRLRLDLVAFCESPSGIASVGPDLASQVVRALTGSGRAAVDAASDVRAAGADGFPIVGGA